MANDLIQVYLKNGEIREYKDICRRIDFVDSLFVMNDECLWAVINLTKGKQLTEYKYSDFRQALTTNRVVNNGLVCSVLDYQSKKWGVLNSRGKEVIECIYDSCCVINPEYVIVEKNGKFGVVNKRNELVIPIKYKHISEEIVKGYFVATDKFGEGLFTPKGEQIIPCKYEIIYAGSRNNILVEDKDGKYDLYNDKGILLKHNIKAGKCYKKSAIDDDKDEVFSPINVFRNIIKY